MQLSSASSIRPKTFRSTSSARLLLVLSNSLHVLERHFDHLDDLIVVAAVLAHVVKPGAEIGPEGFRRCAG